jgi:hypothetical protein
MTVLIVDNSIRKIIQDKTETILIFVFLRMDLVYQTTL